MKNKIELLYNKIMSKQVLILILILFLLVIAGFFLLQKPKKSIQTIPVGETRPAYSEPSYQVVSP